MEAPDGPFYQVDEWTNEALADFPVHCAYRTAMLGQPHLHAHDGYELYFCREGGGRYIAGDKVYEMGAGTFIAVRPHTLHISLPDRSRPFHRFVLAVGEAYLTALSGGDPANAGALRRWLPQPGSDSRQRRLSAPQQLLAQETLAQLERELGTKQPGYALFAASLLLRLFAELDRYPAEPPPDAATAGAPAHTELIERILGYLKEHYQEPVAAAKLCARFGISRSYLFLLFKRHTGSSLVGYLTAYRVNKAKELLRTTRQPIIEIAAAVGFGDVSHFCHTFKKLAGATPSRYRAAATGAGAPVNDRKTKSPPNTARSASSRASP